MHTHTVATFVVIVTLLGSATCQPLLADEIYVDNRLGDDAFDGRAPTPQEGRVGPTRTIRRALDRVRPGDSISITNTGTPYYESFELGGRRLSGYPALPFTINGNGAVISGARRTRPESWEHLGNDLWRFTPLRKGYFQLINGETLLPEIRVANDAKAPPHLERETWCAWQGSIYYQAGAELFRTPFDLPLAVAYESVGATLVDVEHVVIRNVTFRHFRQDGINVHDRSRYVYLEGVKLLENGRAGLSVGGSSLVGLKDSEVAGNREVQLLNTEQAQTELLGTQLGDTPGVPFRIRGGYLLIDGDEVRE